MRAYVRTFQSCYLYMYMYVCTRMWVRMTSSASEASTEAVCVEVSTESDFTFNHHVSLADGCKD